MSIEVLSVGTLSSLIAVGIIEMYYLARRRYTQRALKRILPHRGQRTTIVVPAFPARNPDEGPGLSLDDALALVYILAALRRIGVEGEVYSSEDEMRYAGSGLICIGGPQTNRITKQFMLDHCSGFHLVLDPESTEERRVHRCGDKRIVTSHDKSFWNITWLSAVTGPEQACALAVGLRDHARHAAHGHPRVHLFLATPMGLALLLGHRWNRVAPTTVYEDLAALGYEAAFTISA